MRTKLRSSRLAVDGGRDSLQNQEAPVPVHVAPLGAPAARLQPTRRAIAVGYPSLDSSGKGRHASTVAHLARDSDSGPCPEPISHQAGQKLAQASFGEYLELLALPNDAINPPDIQKNVDFLERAFKKRGFVTKQLANNSKPMLFAEWPKKIPGAKTVLYYMHLDGQPVVDKEWSQPSPWQPVVKKKDSSNNWHIIPTEALFATPSIRIFACSPARPLTTRARS